MSAQQKLQDAWAGIFPDHNRNAGGPQFFKWIHDNATSPSEFDEMNKLFCGVSGSVVSPGRDPLPVRATNLQGEHVCGDYHMCCWPCVCDIEKYARVEPMTFEIGGESIERNMLTIPDVPIRVQDSEAGHGVQVRQQSHAKRGTSLGGSYRGGHAARRRHLHRQRPATFVSVRGAQRYVAVYTVVAGRHGRHFRNTRVFAQRGSGVQMRLMLFSLHSFLRICTRRIPFVKNSRSPPLCAHTTGTSGSTGTMGTRLVWCVWSPYFFFFFSFFLFLLRKKKEMSCESRVTSSSGRSEFNGSSSPAVRSVASQTTKDAATQTPTLTAGRPSGQRANLHHHRWTSTLRRRFSRLSG